MASTSCINFMLATKKFITLILYDVFLNVMIEPNSNLCNMNRAFIFEKRIKKNCWKMLITFLCVSKLVAQCVCPSVVPGDRIVTSSWVRQSVLPIVRFYGSTVFTVSLILIKTKNKKKLRIKKNFCIQKKKAFEC